jgi:hypothetical protein
VAPRFPRFPPKQLSPWLLPARKRHGTPFLPSSQPSHLVSLVFFSLFFFSIISVGDVRACPQFSAIFFFFRLCTRIQNDQSIAHRPCMLGAPTWIESQQALARTVNRASSSSTKTFLFTATSRSQWIRCSHHPPISSLVARRPQSSRQSQ